MTRIAAVAVTLTVAALEASLVGCVTPPEERSLAELTQLAITVTADTGVPDVLDPALRGSLGADLADPQFECFSISSHTHLELDGEREDYRLLGGPYKDENHGTVETGCDTPSFIMNEVPDDEITSSELYLSDGTADYMMTVPALGKNPHLSLAGALHRNQPAVIVVDDPRPVVYASIRWMDVQGSAWTVSPDFTTPGELRFTVPASGTTGDGELAIEVRVHATDVVCDGFASCDVTIYGGDAFPAPVLP